MTGAPAGRSGSGIGSARGAGLAFAGLVVSLGVILAGACGSEDSSRGSAQVADPAAALAEADAAQVRDVVPPDAVGAGDTPDSDSDAEEGDAEQLLDPLSIRGAIISEYNLAVGDCFNQREGLQAGRFVEVTARVDCDDPHLGEVFHYFDIDAAHPSIFPGDDPVRDFARRVCYDHFRAFVGQSYELSVYEIGVIIPNRVNFEDAAARYRGVHCWLRHLDREPLVGSAAGTGI